MVWLYQENMVATDQKRAVGVLPSRKLAEQSINELKASNFPMDKIHIFAKDADRRGRIGEVQVSSRISNQNVDTTGVVGGALSAGFWGSVLVGLGSLVLPSSVGTLIAVGSIGGALVMSVGAVAVSAVATNNLVKVLTRLGIPEERARCYGDRIQYCEYLLMLEGTDEDIRSGETILRKCDIQYWGIYDPLPDKT